MLELTFAGFTVEMFARLLVAMLLGMLLGTERTIARKTAGLRTYGLVAMGSALPIVIFELLGSALPATSDPMRIVTGILTGIGFIGAGVIFTNNAQRRVTGLTTAAGLWVAAGIGIAAGFGLYVPAIMATTLTLLAFTLFWFIERKVERALDVRGHI